MSNDNFKKELSIAKKAAMSAGDALLANKNNLNQSILSSDKDIKLQADITAENLIKEILEKESIFSILAEESGKSSENLGNTFWVVDPLDGTVNYSRNIPLCCVSIALIKDLKPLVGVIYDFNNKDIYAGEINGSATLNGVEICVSNTKLHKEGILLTGLPNNSDYSDEAILKMIKDFQTWRKVRMIGSAAMASAYVASGKADVYKEFGTYLWDVAAGAAIVNAAGGTAKITNQKNNFQVDVFFSNSQILD
tara:strand:- start:1062 stop:1814 length:753 start_codon:yes stop_codon:yes gene_type:complete